MAVKQKLCSRLGATLMAALLFFLVAAVCGSIILAAATATVSRVKNQAKDAQAYYAVTSAAQLIRDDLMDSRWLITLNEEYENHVIKSGSTTITGIQLVDKYMKPLKDEDMKKTFVRDLLFGSSISNLVTADEIQISVSNVGDVDVFPTIYAKAKSLPYTDPSTSKTVDEGCKLSVTLTNDTSEDRFTRYKETDDDGHQLYWVKISLRSVKNPAGFQILSDGRVNGTGTVTRTICIGWDDPVLEKEKAP